VRLARSLASQAAVSIENAQLHGRIERTLESVVKVAVTAIDQRDPTTAGHSLRVAKLSTALAEAVERSGDGPYHDTRFTSQQIRELRFAALLHDFGKLVVSEDILVKAKKLPPVLWERVDARFDLIHRTIELEHARKGGSDKDLVATFQDLEEMRAIVRRANEPAILAEPPDSALQDIARRTFVKPDGRVARYLTEEELHYLRIPHGTLDDRDRTAIEYHVEATYQFLNGIPWTDDLKNIPAYAYGHHEKLDGTGYPRRLRGDEIPVQTRIITLSDIFDALTESDRPYKPAVTATRALDILQSEAEAGRLDPVLLGIMTESKVYTTILTADWRQF
jgi:HD-GYP domain-containing protein (c-di-GMP phosphodiesterase class II)